jgi:DnaJ-domain-containing protein 1
VTDRFALLNEPRRPWLEEEGLKIKFLSLSTRAHPDKTLTAKVDERKCAEQRYAELNAAYQCLRDPRERVKHLLELELGTKPKQVQSVPGELMDCSLAVAQLCRQVDAFLAEKATKTSPLLQIPLFERGQDWREKVDRLQNRILLQREELLRELKALDNQWVSSVALGGDERNRLLHRLEELSALLSYFDKWRAQLQERLVQLSF